MAIPLVAAALAAVAPTLAAKGADLLANVFSGAVTKGTEKVAEMVEAKTGISIQDMADGVVTNDQWEKVRQFEQDHKAEILTALVELDKNAVERERVAAADRGGARAMQQTTMASSDKAASRFIYFYATLITLLTFGFIFWASFFHNYEQFPKSERIIDTTLGFLLGVALASIVQFFFGSSAGSKSKEEKLSQALMEQKP